MKKSVITFLAFLVGSQMAFASAKRDVRLEYKNVPIVRDYHLGSQSVRVYADGAVVSTRCTIASDESSCTHSFNGRFSKRRMAKLDRMIENVDTTKVEEIGSAAMCFMAPLDTNIYEADNGEVFLRQGHICNGFEVNKTEEAQELVRILTELSSGQSPAQILIYEP